MRKKRKFWTWKKCIFIILFIAFILGSGFYLYTTYNNIVIDNNQYQTEALSTNTEQTVDNVKAQSETVSDSIEEISKKVVGISKLKNTGSSILSKSSESELGLGTGIIVTDNGYILSNEHVTGSKFSKCYVTLEDGTTYDGTVAWSDSNLDLSITKIEAKNLSPVTFANSSKIRVGETVYAIGNPIGYEFRRTVTSGIISAKNRTIKIDEQTDGKTKSSYMTDLIQTDATINPGNSGGPLMYADGTVIGVNTVKISSAEGIGFAVPTHIITPIIDSFRETGDFQEATLGIYAYDKEVIPYLDATYKLNFDTGIYVAQITENGPASNSILKEGDIILTIDNRSLNTMNDLRQYIYTKKPGDVVNLQIKSGKISKEVSITLGKKN